MYLVWVCRFHVVDVVLTFVDMPWTIFMSNLAIVFPHAFSDGWSSVGGDDSNIQSTGEKMVQASLETLSLHRNRTGCL